MHSRPLLDVIPSTEDAGLLRSYERHQRARNFSPNTLEHRSITLRKFVGFCQDEHLPQLRNVSREHVELWLESMHETLRANTVASYARNLRAFYKWMVDDDEIKVSPMARIKAPVIEESPKDVVSKDDLDRVLATLEKAKRWRDLVLIATIYDTGVRVGELADCMTEDVNLDLGLILIRRTKGRRPRTVPISPKAVRFIDRYLRTPRVDPEYLINGTRGHMTGDGISHRIAVVFKEMGVSGRIAAHDLRHTSATHAYGKMTDSEMMTIYGWKNADMLRHYADQGRVEAAINAHRRASPLENLPRAKKR